jgi:DNA-binding XRE family transcriptional regulator
MQSDYRNIYQDARRTAGLTQERWAELLGISVDAETV